jgi:predicted DsbA family dithiol-disulfide isomerase
MSELVEVTEFTDPGCAWSWGSESVLRWLEHRYAGHLRWRRVFGIQLDGGFGTSADPPEEVRARWLRVSAHTDAPVGERLHWSHVSTRPAALAAKAAERQGPQAAAYALRRLREAFFVAGRPPDTPERIADALNQLPGLDVEVLLADLEAIEVLSALEADWLDARAPHPAVIGLAAPAPHPGAAKDEGGGTRRYAFPTVILNGPAGERVVPGWRAPEVYREAVEAVAPALASVAAPALDPATALLRYRSLTPADLILLTGSAEPPPDAVGRSTATTSLWLLPEEAEHLATGSLSRASA